MSILVDKNSRVVVQGITGSAGSFHTKHCIAYGTQVVAGVTPNRGGHGGAAVTWSAQRARLVVDQARPDAQLAT